MADFLRGLAEALTRLSADEAVVARRAFRALLEGRAAPATTLAAPPLSPDTAAAGFRPLPGPGDPSALRGDRHVGFGPGPPGAGEGSAGAMSCMSEGSWSVSAIFV